MTTTGSSPSAGCSRWPRHWRHAARQRNPQLRSARAQRDEVLMADIKRVWHANWQVYHRRSLVETKMNCFKRLGERVMARTFERQVTELHIRVALLNRFSQLGRPVTVAVWPKSVWGWGYCVRTGLCATTPFESPDVLPSNRHPAFRDQAPASFIALTPHVPQHPAYGRCDAVLNSLARRQCPCRQHHPSSQTQSSKGLSTEKGL